MKHCLSALCLCVLSLGASAHEYQIGKIHIAHPWARAMPASSPTSAVYFGLDNQGADGDRLLSAETPRAKAAELHSNTVEQGVMHMRKIEGGVAVPAGGKMAFAPGGLHVMLIGLSGELKVGERFPMTLRFEKAGKVDVQVQVEKGMPGGH
ncbi:copper chaperone PCu(A)C [Paludibacterium paludis]|uniref:Copper chaperone PCu(A)C n=1 Tax=Paludibacterium paludis TaxID=1225769 RepID=A0A918P058_9NEIS|nr:copper chaperone PCu(A)C [Paludibacterium paludis]GGY09179.1 hypothetical protein GCM10011289_09880 [Paludibacterium paludis]